ncbi:aldo/keto reductase [Streptomyces sp. NRRL S-813]|uniref:aldo/keto reductase n=1 Tax=Streptomyces sp. NRRL S-813 TaxID=1463919 RepID=UPI0004C0BD5D|nr:aldo/keto reductase [Streptomyces sp. NRRL S-813]
MRTTTLGTHGLQAGVIVLGAMGMSFAYDMATPRDEATSVSVIHQALDLGMTLIDTADVYGPYTNEELVGRALAGRRDRAVIATKVGMECIDPTGGPAGAAQWPASACPRRRRREPSPSSTTQAGAAS